jgi:hypothetical protein
MKPKILIVEDEPAIADNIQFYVHPVLNKRGDRVYKA